MTEWQQEENKKALQLKNDLNKLVGLQFVLSDFGDENLKRVEYIGKEPIRVSKEMYGKQINFYLDYQKLAFIDFNDYKASSEKFNKPNNVSVLSAKKINDWIDYLVAIYNDLESLSHIRSIRVDNFINKMEKAGIVAKESSYDRKLRGRIDKNGLTYSFSIDTRNGYISQEISLDYGYNKNFEAFMALTDNTFKKENYPFS